MTDDGIVAHFKELQQEKKKLQNRLDHFRFRRKDLESKQGSVTDKNRLLQQKHDNMSRTIEIAKRKLQESQLQVEKLQNENDEHQAYIKLVKTSLQKEEDTKDTYLIKLQNQFDELSNDFRGAKKFYEDEELEKEVEHWKNTCQRRKISIETGAELVNQISTQLKEMNLSKTDSDEKPAKSSWKEVNTHQDFLTSLFQEDFSKLESLITQEQNKSQHLGERITVVMEQLKTKQDELKKIHNTNV